MKILHLTSQFPPGPGYGTSRYVWELARALASVGRHEIHVVVLSLQPTASSQGSEESRDGVSIHRVGADAKERYPFKGYNEYLQAVLTNMPLAEKVIQVCKQRGPFEAVVAHGWDTSLAAALTQRMSGCRLVAGLGASTPTLGVQNGKAVTREEAYVWDMERWISGRSDRVVVPSEFAKDKLVRSCGIASDKIGVVAGAVRAEAFQVDVDVEFRETFAQADEDLVLYVGRLERDKGPDLFIQAAGKILENRPKTRFVLAGDGEMRLDLQESIDRMSIRGKIGFPGHLGSAVLGALYQVSDVLVVPSRSESFSFAALEALLHDLPVVASKTGALVEMAQTAPEILRLVSPEDPEALAKWVLRTLESKKCRNRDPAPDQKRMPATYWPERVAAQAERALGPLAKDRKAA